MGFWESTLGDGEIMQHHVFTVSTLAMGAVEFRARSGKGSVMLPYVLPVLIWLGAIILFAHGHAGFEPKSEYLIKATHTVTGVLAIIMAVADVGWSSAWYRLAMKPKTTWPAWSAAWPCWGLPSF